MFGSRVLFEGPGGNRQGSHFSKNVRSADRVEVFLRVAIANWVEAGRSDIAEIVQHHLVGAAAEKVHWGSGAETRSDVPSGCPCGDQADAAIISRIVLIKYELGVVEVPRADALNGD